MKKSFFSTPAFLLVIITLVMFNNLEHGAELYYKITKDIYPANWLPYIHLQAYLVIVVIDLAVIGFIVNGKTKDSKAFAWLLFIINCIFWNVLTEIDSTHYKDMERLSMLLAKVFFSAAFSYLIHKISTLYFEKINGFSSIEQARADNEQLQAHINELLEQVNQSQALIEQTKAVIDQSLIDMQKIKLDKENYRDKFYAINNEINKITEDLVCSTCYKFKADHTKGIATALKSLNAHKGICKTEQRIDNNE